LTVWHDLRHETAHSRRSTISPFKSHKWILDLRSWGKRRLFFKTRAEGDAECLRQRTLLERHSREAVGLSQREMSDFITARDRLEKFDETINHAVEFRIDHLERVRRHGITLEQLTAELLETKRKDGRSEIYLRDLRNILAIFVRDFGSRAVAGITVEELVNWLRALPGSPKTRTNFRANIGVLFSLARQRRIITENPIEFTAKPKLPDNPPAVFAVDQLRAMLEAAQRVEPDVLPMLALGAFAGLRDAEIKRLDWAEVDRARKHIEITAVKAKSAKRRIVPIQANLAAWLRPL
jgi:integrase